MCVWGCVLGRMCRAEMEGVGGDGGWGVDGVSTPSPLTTHPLSLACLLTRRTSHRDGLPLSRGPVSRQPKTNIEIFHCSSGPYLQQFSRVLGEGCYSMVDQNTHHRHLVFRFFFFFLSIISMFFICLRQLITYTIEIRWMALVLLSSPSSGCVL